MPRGGKRQGAGAPKGNINALKTGQHSRQMGELLEKVPEGFFVLDKKTRRLNFLRKKEDLEKLGSE